MLTVFSGYEVSKTLEGHGLKVITVEGEDIDSLWGGISTAIATDGPVAGEFSHLFAHRLHCVRVYRLHSGVSTTLRRDSFEIEILTIHVPPVISKRKMAPGISGIEGSPHGHDVVSVDGAVNYLKERGYGEEVWGILKVRSILPPLRLSCSSEGFAYQCSSEGFAHQCSSEGEAITVLTLVP